MGNFDRIDRILLGACAAVWLVALGAGVAAAVALVDLGTGRAQATGASGTPWLLYAVIAISAAVIIGAVPLLLRARRAAQQVPLPPVDTPVRAAPRHPEAPTEKIRIGGPPASGPGYPTREAIIAPPNPSAGPVDQIGLRCAVVIAIAMGVALAVIGVATYLMAVNHDAVAWVFYALVGLVVLGMPAIPLFYLRELRALAAQ